MRSINATDLQRGARSYILAAFFGVAALPGSLAAAAEPTVADAALAETLFREGKDGMAKKQFDVACPKLAESYRLDPGMGTLLALALCHEGEGKLASAWVEFTEVLAASEARPDRALVARDHIAQVEPSLSRLKVVVSPEVLGISGLEIERDGLRIDRPAWGTAVPVDGGEHVVTARAPGRKAWSVRLDVAVARDQRIVAVPMLDEEAGVPPRFVEPSSPPQAVRTPDVVRERWGVALGALAVVGFGTGAYFGVTAITKIHDAKAQCPAAPACTSQGPVNENADGFRDATIADVALGIGLLAGIAGTFLVVSGRSRSTASTRVSASIARDGGMVTIEQRF